MKEYFVVFRHVFNVYHVTTIPNEILNENYNNP